MRRALLLLLLAVSAIVAACSTAAIDVVLEDEVPFVSPSPTGLNPYGMGLDGDHVITESMSVNTCQRPTVAATIGTSIAFDGGVDDDFHVGRLAFVWQVAAVAGSAGAFDIVRILSTAGTLVTEPLSRNYANSGDDRTLVCTVPEYDDLTIDEDAAVIAKPWTGNVNGVVVFLVNGIFTMNGGSLIADETGFIGGECESNNAIDRVETIDAGNGGKKGEGIAGVNGAGRLRSANGGGGGNPVRAGGGGGGSASAGGAGGLGPLASENFGEGGNALPVSPSALQFGGAGGGGHSTSPAPESAKNCIGGHGGGVIFFQARRAAGAGEIRANGRGHTAVPGPGSSGGGGGAGGTIWAVIGTDDGFHPVIEAVGGNGGDGCAETAPVTNDGCGGGGGGSGGRTKLQGFQAESRNVDGGVRGAAQYLGTNGGMGGFF